MTKLKILRFVTTIHFEKDSIYIDGILQSSDKSKSFKYTEVFVQTLDDRNDVGLVLEAAGFSTNARDFKLHKSKMKGIWISIDGRKSLDNYHTMMACILEAQDYLRKCTGCRTLSELTILPKTCAGEAPILLCDECIERLKIPVKNILAITGTTEIDLMIFIKKYMS